MGVFVLCLETVDEFLRHLRCSSFHIFILQGQYAAMRESYSPRYTHKCIYIFKNLSVTASSVGQEILTFAAVFLTVDQSIVFYMLPNMGR